MFSFPGGEDTAIDARRAHVGFAKSRAMFAVPLRNVGRGLARIDPTTISVTGEGLSHQYRNVTRHCPGHQRDPMPVSLTSR